MSIIPSFFNKKPLIEQDTANWIIDTFQWALDNFDKNEFYKRSQLVQPNNQFFPGKVDSVHAMASNIFKHTLNYSGLAQWPFKLQAPEQFQGLPPPRLQLDHDKKTVERDSVGPAKNELVTEQEALFVSYKPQQTGKPEDLSSTFAHLLAQHVCLQTQKQPPGGLDFFAAGTEVLGVFMGFGVMFANSAFTYRGGCGSCFNAQANRQSTLSEEEAVFALAVYCHLKNIPNKEATQHLKPHLKKHYKQALTQVRSLEPILESHKTA